MIPLESLECPICYDLFQSDNCVTLQECRHQFCLCCMEEVLFKFEAECPIDRGKTENIIIGGSQISLIDYRYETTKTLIDITNKDVERYLNNNFHRQMKTFKDYFNKISSMFEDYIHNQLTLEIVQIYDEARKLYWGGVTSKGLQSDLQADKLEFYLANFYEDKPLNYSLAKYYAIENVSQLFMKDGHDVHIYFDSMDGMTDCPQFVKDKIVYIEGYLDKLEEVNTIVTCFVICDFVSNEEMYRNVRPEIDRLQTEKCMTCIKLLKENDCVHFTGCAHKICLNCITKFLITHASCPFDKTKLDDMINHNKHGNVSRLSLTDYAKENHERTLKELTNINMEYITKQINLIVQLRKDFPNLIECFGAIERELQVENHGEKVKELYLELLNSCRNFDIKQMYRTCDTADLDNLAYEVNFIRLLYLGFSELHFQLNEDFIQIRRFLPIIVKILDSFNVLLRGLQEPERDPRGVYFHRFISINSEFRIILLESTQLTGPMWELVDVLENSLIKYPPEILYEDEPLDVDLGVLIDELQDHLMNNPPDSPPLDDPMVMEE